jgi:hypothetical protein
MTHFIHKILLLLCCALLMGCQTGKDEMPEDRPLSDKQKDSALTRTRPPQQFGFSVFAIERGITFGGRGRLHPNHFTTAEMIEEQIPVLSMRGRSKRSTLNALIDTSSPVSWMEFSTSKAFNAYFMSVNEQLLPYLGGYNTGGIDAFAAVVTQLRIDNLFIENVPFYVRMSSGSLGPLARGIYDPQVDAVIGYDNLKAFEYVQFNLRDSKISFSATTPYSPMEGIQTEAAVIERLPGHGLAVEGIIDGISTPVLLDLAGDFSFARGDVDVATTRSIEVGDLAFEDTPTLLLPVQNIPPRVGRELLAPYVITICNKEGLVYFEKLPEDD